MLLSSDGAALCTTCLADKTLEPLSIYRRMAGLWSGGGQGRWGVAAGVEGAGGSRPALHVNTG